MSVYATGLPGDLTDELGDDPISEVLGRPDLFVDDDDSNEEAEEDPEDLLDEAIRRKDDATP